MLPILLSLLLSAQPTLPASGAEVLTRMHDRYAGKWFSTLTFVQKTVIHKPDGSQETQTWYEALSAPSRLRIDREHPSKGNGVLYTADSMYVVRGGAIVRMEAEGNPFIPFVSGVYAQPVAQSQREVAALKVDMSRVRADRWQGRAVWVVGATDSADVTSPQFWVDTDRLVLVRMFVPLGAPAPADIHLDEYVQRGGSWIATKIAMYQDGVVRQTEEYTDVRVNVPLSATLFDATRWNAGPHWMTRK